MNDKLAFLGQGFIIISYYFYLEWDYVEGEKNIWKKSQNRTKITKENHTQYTYKSRRKKLIRPIRSVLSMSFHKYLNTPRDFPQKNRKYKPEQYLSNSTSFNTRWHMLWHLLFSSTLVTINSNIHSELNHIQLNSIQCEYIWILWFCEHIVS